MLKTGDELGLLIVREFADIKKSKLRRNLIRKNRAIHNHVPVAGRENKENIMKTFRTVKHGEYKFGEHQTKKKKGGQNG
jgi:hypothetical protein